MENTYNLLYKGRKIYTNLTMEDCSEILQNFSERFYSGEDVSFCLDAKEAGFEIWCDPRIRVGHEKTRII